MRDSAVSDIIATIMLLGVTVSIASAVALQASDVFSPERPIRMSLDIVLIARPGDSSITLLHAGGNALDAQALRALVHVDGIVWSDGNASATSTAWRIGDTLTIGPFAQAIPVNAVVDVTIAHLQAGGVLASAWTRTTPPTTPGPASAPGFSIELTLARGLSEVVLEPPAGLLVEANVIHPEGRKFIRHVYANFTGFNGIDWQELHDDGVNGDRRTGDGIYSAVALVPVNTTSGQATVTVSAVDFNGTSISRAGNITILLRDEVTEKAANPTGSPAPGGSTCPAGIAAIRKVEYQLNNATLVPSLQGHVRQGDRVRAMITLADGCTNIEVTLAVYKATSPQFSFSDATAQTVHSSTTINMNTDQAIIQVDVPLCHFSIDLARGSLISTFGPASSNNYYSRQARLIDSDNGGTTPCA